MAKKKKAVYAALFVDDSEKPKIKKWFERATGQAILPKEFAHHITLKFKPSEMDMAELVRKGLGSEHLVRLTGAAGDSKGQAATAQLPAGIRANNPIPHLTIATSPSTKPVYSNELLKDGVTKLDGSKGLAIKTKLGFFDGKDNRFSPEGTIYE